MQLEPCSNKGCCSFLLSSFCKCWPACQYEKGDMFRSGESRRRSSNWSLHQNRSGHDQGGNFGTSLRRPVGMGPLVDNRGIPVHLRPQSELSMDNQGILVHRGLASVAKYMEMQKEFRTFMGKLYLRTHGKYLRYCLEACHANTQPTPNRFD